MASNYPVYEDHSLLSKIDQWVFKIEAQLGLVGGLIIFMLVFLAVANVTGRWFLNMPVDGYIDWVEQFMAFFAFLGIAYTQRLGGHIRMDMVIGRFHGRVLWFAELISVLLMLGVTLVLIYGSYLHFLRAYVNGDSSFDIDLPTWPAKLVVPVALSFLALRLLLQVWAYCRALKTGSNDPVAVPIIEDPATIAEREAQAIAKINQSKL
jgi:TRAP-type C4-dicarboxylate transport system permease small subunit